MKISAMKFKDMCGSRTGKERAVSRILSKDLKSTSSTDRVVNTFSNNLLGY